MVVPEKVSPTTSKVTLLLMQYLLLMRLVMIRFGRVANCSKALAR
jgi:hypothetical protein